MSSTTVHLRGGAPWGFKLAGGTDHKQPLSISKVNVGSKAEKAGMPEGFHISRINGNDVSQLTHMQAMNMIKQSGFAVVFELSKPRGRSESLPAPYSPLPSPASSISSNSSNYSRNMESHRNDLYRPTPKPYSSTASSYSPAASTTSSTGRRSPDGSSVYQSPTFNKVFEGAARPRFASMRDQEPPKKIEVSSDIARLIREEEEEKERAKLRRQQEQAAGDNAPPVAAVQQQQQGTNNAHKTISKFLGNINTTANRPTLANTREPDFAKSLVDTCKPLGEPVVLEVRLTECNPAPSVHWYHNNKPTHESVEKDIRILCNGTIHTLVLGELTNDQVGRYTCTIMNRNGSKSSRCNVTVDTQGQEKTSRPAFMHSAPVSKNNGAGMRGNGQISQPAKFILASSNKDLYSNRNVAKAYHHQVVKPAQREAMGEESAVLRALRLEEGQPIVTPPTDGLPLRKSRTMQILENQLVNEQELEESEDL